MQNDSSNEPRHAASSAPRSRSRAGKKKLPQLNFCTTFEKRQDVRAIHAAEERTLQSLMNEATDLLIAKYRKR